MSHQHPERDESDQKENKQIKISNYSYNNKNKAMNQRLNEKKTCSDMDKCKEWRCPVIWNVWYHPSRIFLSYLQKFYVRSYINILFILNYAFLISFTHIYIFWLQTTKDCCNRMRPLNKREKSKRLCTLLNKKIRRTPFLIKLFHPRNLFIFLF